MDLSNFWHVTCCAFVILPIPIGYLWVWLYRNRDGLGFPDWFSGILAQGIVSGHNIHSGDGEDKDYGFIIIATTVTVLTMIIIYFCLLSLFTS
jgi:hypothetical protein